MCIKYTKQIALLALTLSTLLYSIGSIGAQDLEFSLLTPYINSKSVREYKKDAARLALGHLIKESPSYSGLRIPQHIQNSLFKALMAIHNSSDSHAREVCILGIHTKPKPYYIDHIKVDCDSESTLTAPLIPGGTSTSNQEINTLLKEYKLEIGNYNEEENSFTISAPVPINMSKLAKVLSKLDDGIEYTLVPEIREPDHNIEANYMGNDTWRITFIKYENGTQKKWSFKVDGKEQVSYLSKK